MVIQKVKLDYSCCTIVHIIAQSRWVKIPILLCVWFLLLGVYKNGRYYFPKVKQPEF